MRMNRTEGQTKERKTNDIHDSTSMNSYERNHQQLMLEQQDVHLDSMLGTVSSLRGIAGTMHQELDDQNMYSLSCAFSIFQLHLSVACWMISNRESIQHRRGYIKPHEELNTFCREIEIKRV